MSWAKGMETSWTGGHSITGLNAQFIQPYWLSTNIRLLLFFSFSYWYINKINAFISADIGYVIVHAHFLYFHFYF